MRPDQPPPPWERRELPRKHERSPPAATTAQRWRDRELSRSSPSPCGPSSGLYSSTPSRAERISPEGESSRPSGRYGGGVARESRGSLRQRSPCRSPSDDSSQRPLWPPPPPLTGLRSLAVPIAATAAQAPLKDQLGRSNDGKDASFGTGTGQKLDRDHSLGPMGWKSAKWSRPSSLSLPKDEDAAAKDASTSSPETSPQDADDGAPRKKARLGWGQGLAKYEKQKVQGSLDSPVAGAKSCPGDSSPGVTGSEGFPSSMCPFSPRCSSSPAITDEKPCTSATGCDITASHCDLCGVDSVCKEFTMKLDTFEVKSASSLKALLDDVLQPEDACSGDSTSTRHAAMNKLLLLKVDISKELEKTECEIDFLEGELKSLDSGAKSASLLPIIVSAKVSIVSSDGASKDDVQPEGNSSAISQAEPEHPISSFSLEKRDSVLTDLKTDSSLAVSFGCEGASLNKGISHVEQGEPAESTTIMDIHGLELQGVQQDTPLEQMTTTKCGDGSLSCIETSSSSRYCSVPACSHDGMNCNLISCIMESNWEVAKRAPKAFHRALPSNPPRINMWELVKLPSKMKNDKKIKEKIYVRKRLLKLKEKVLTLKFMAFHQLWKEDLRLLSIKKNHAKSNKRFDISSRSSHAVSQKLRSSVRSRFGFSECSLAPSAEVLELMCKLLSNSQIKLHRCNLRMPALILDNEEREFRKFVHKNGLIEDPPSLELERSRLNPWTQEEKEVFMEMLATFGKNFTKISSFLSHKTAADCIEYYYKNHKSESFSEAKKRLGITKQSKHLPSSTYLVTSGRKSNRETNAAALDMLGEASAVAAYNHESLKTKQKDDGKSVYQNCHDLKAPWGSYSSFDKVRSAELSVHERESVAADVLAGISSALSSEGMSSCVTSSIGHAVKKNFSEMDQPVSQNFDEDSCSDEDCGGLDSIDWTDDEKSSFVRALSIYGKDFTKISNYLGTRSREQCKTFFSKTRSCLDLDVIHLGNGNAGMASDNTNGGRSDTDDACAADIDSAICSDQSCSKVTGDVSQPVANANCDLPVQSEVDRSSEQDAMGGIDFAESCADKEESTINNDKLISGEDNPRPHAALKESNNAASSCNASVYLQKNAEKMDTESRIVGNNIDTHTGQHAIEAPIDFDAISHSGGVFRQKDTRGKSSSDMLKREVNSPHSVVTETGSKNRRRASFDLGASSSVICFAQDLNSNENVLRKGSVAGAIPRPTSAPSYQHQELPPHMLRSNPAVPFKQETILSSAFCDPSSLCFAGSPHIACQNKTTLNFQEHANRQHQNSAAARELYQQYTLKNAQLNQFNQPMHILKGYPLSMLHQKEIKREEHPASERSLLLDSSLKGDGFSLPSQFVSSIQSGITNGLSHPQLGSGILRAAKTEDPSEIQTRHWSQTAVPETKKQPTNRPGDVKLFGKIITQPPSSQNANTSMQENQSKHPLPQLNESLNVMPSSIRKDGVAFPCRPGSSSHVSLSEQPGTSYGIWDASRLQAGLSDPSCMMATYRALGPGMPFIMSREGRPKSNIAMTDYQQSYMQQLSSDGRRNDNFSLLQSRNTVEIVPGFKPSGSIAHVGANLLGNGGIFVAGKGVSDPVAALKMQYASSSCSKVSETEFWRRDTGGK